jgi:menaquinone-dependent protoporphyrinogen oxidase
VLNAADRSIPVSFDGIDRVVLAAPVHERRHPKDFEVLLTANKEILKRLPTMMLSVSLKASFPEGLEEAEDYLTEMKMRTGLTFDQDVLVAGAVRTESYGYFESQIVQNVVLNGRPVDLVEGVREFTDWDNLSAEVDAFLNNDPKETG